MDPGLLGGLIGSVLGIVGGAIGTYVSIKKTTGPQERAFMIHFAIIVWIAIIIFLALLLTLPKPYNLLMWIPYGILLPLGIRYCNKKQSEIRQQNQQQINSNKTDN